MWSYLSAGGRASRSGLVVALLVNGGLTAACGDAPADSVNGAGTGGDAANRAGAPASSGAAGEASNGAEASASPGGSGPSHAGSGNGEDPAIGGAAAGSGAGGGANTSAGGTAGASGGVTSAGGAGSGGGGVASAGSAGSAGGLPNPLGAPQVFIEKCAVCHGVDAKGAVTGPEVEHTPGPLVTYYVRNGDDNTWMGCDVDNPSSTRPCSSWGDQRVMTAFPANEVSDADITAITAWLAALPKPATGAALYADYCAGCHGPGGDIPTFTYYVKGPGPVQSADLAKLRTTVADGLTANRQIDERSRYMPPFKALLSDAEVTLIARWMCTQTFSVTPPFCAQL